MQGVGIGRRKSKAERKQARKERKAKRQERRKEKGSRIAKIGLAPARAAFLKAVQLNALKLAEKLARIYKKDSTKLFEFWRKFGGDTDKLKQAIEKGIKQKLAGIGVVGLAAGLSAALPIIMTVLKLLKDMGLSKGDEEADDEAAINEAKTNLELDGSTEKGNVNMPEGEDVALVYKKEGEKTTEEVDEPEPEGKGNLKRMLLIGGGLAAALVVYSLIKRQRPQQ
jgi:hypothetical protein